MLRKCVLALLVLTALASARVSEAQTILFAGNEDIDFSAEAGALFGVNNCNQQVTAYTYVDDYMGVDNTATGVPNAYVRSAPFTAETTMWAHFMAFNNLNYVTACSGGYTSNNADGEIVRFFSPDGVPRIIVQGTGTVGSIKISTENGAGTITDLITCTGWPLDTAGAAGFVDVYVNYATAGEVAVYAINSLVTPNGSGTKVCDYTGNVTTDTATTLDQFEIAGVGTGNWAELAEVLVSTTDTRLMRLRQLHPQAAGTTQQWPGASVGNIAKTGTNDISFNSSSTADQISNWTLPGLPAGYVPLAVKEDLRVLVGTTGPLHFGFTVQPNGQTTQTTAAVAATTSFADYTQYWATNPATSAPWAASDFTGMNLGIESLP